MKAKEYFNDLGFNISQNFKPRSVWVHSWGWLISTMLYDNLIEIWHKLDYSERTDGSLLTNLTPTIRQLSNPDKR